MKKAELRNIIREEIWHYIYNFDNDYVPQPIREGMIDKFMDRITKVVKDDAKRRAVADVNKDIANSMKRIADEEDNIRQLINGKLTPEEMKQLAARIKG